MDRIDYRHALRSKGVVSLPPYGELRTRKDGDGEHVEIFTPRCERPPPEVFL